MAMIVVRKGAQFRDFDKLAGAGSDAHYSPGGSILVKHAMDGHHVTFKGFGFSYNSNGSPISGVATSVETFFEAGNSHVLFKNLSIDLPPLVAAFESPTAADERSLFWAELGGADVMIGHDKADLFKGRGGSDRIWGGNGGDRIDGGAGNDRIVGGLGADILTGGSGRDLFRFENQSETRIDKPDLVRDFEPGRDRFDFQKMDADIYTEGNQSFVFIGAAEFGGHAGELRFAGGRLYGDVDGDAQADFLVRVADVSSLRSLDIIL